MSNSEIRRAEAKLGELSAVGSCLAISQLVSSMHDPTEGGMLGGAIEISVASGRDIELWEEKIPVDKVTKKICSVMHIDPLRVFASGALSATAEKGKRVVEELERIGIKSTIIGNVRKRSKRPELLLHRGNSTEEIKEVRDELCDLSGHSQSRS